MEGFPNAIILKIIYFLVGCTAEKGEKEKDKEKEKGFRKFLILFCKQKWFNVLSNYSPKLLLLARQFYKNYFMLYKKEFFKYIK